MRYMAPTKATDSPGRLKRGLQAIDDILIHEAGHVVLAFQAGYCLQDLVLWYDGSGLTRYWDVGPDAPNTTARGPITGEWKRRLAEDKICVLMAGIVAQRLWCSRHGRRPPTYQELQLVQGPGDVLEYTLLLDRLETHEDKMENLQARLLRETRRRLSDPSPWTGLCRLVEYGRAVISRELDIDLLGDQDQPSPAILVRFSQDELLGSMCGRDMETLLQERARTRAAAV